jgi:hypothetical protein
VRSRLQAVGEEDAALIGDEPAQAQVVFSGGGGTQRAESALTGLLITSLRALSQRTIVALASLVDLALLGSVFALMLMVISSPSQLQLVAIAGYGSFVLGALWMRRT